MVGICGNLWEGVNKLIMALIRLCAKKLLPISALEKFALKVALVVCTRLIIRIMKSSYSCSTQTPKGNVIKERSCRKRNVLLCNLLFQ